jgi:hypothetical protein
MTATRIFAGAAGRCTIRDQGSGIRGRGSGVRGQGSGLARPGGDLVVSMPRSAVSDMFPVQNVSHVSGPYPWGGPPLLPMLSGVAYQKTKGLGSHFWAKHLIPGELFTDMPESTTCGAAGGFLHRKICTLPVEKTRPAPIRIRALGGEFACEEGDFGREDDGSRAVTNRRAPHTP